METDIKIGQLRKVIKPFWSTESFTLYVKDEIIIIVDIFSNFNKINIIGKSGKTCINLIVLIECTELITE